MENHRRDGLLTALGERVRRLREARGLSRQELASTSRLSVRYLADLESGTGNISIARLADVAGALAIRLSGLFRGIEAGESSPSPGTSSGPVIALLGLRGAGKSTVGAALAARLGVAFHELDQLVEQAAGMSLGQLFEIHGERYFRRLERETLARFLVESRQQASVLATGGGIVTEPQSFELMRRHTTTVWLRARAREHWDRVLAQGDRRPMAQRGAAMDELQALLTAREPLYARAELQVDTSALSVEEAVDRIVQHVRLVALASRA